MATGVSIARPTKSPNAKTGPRARKSSSTATKPSARGSIPAAVGFISSLLARRPTANKTKSHSTAPPPANITRLPAPVSSIAAGESFMILTPRAASDSAAHCPKSSSNSRNNLLRTSIVVRTPQLAKMPAEFDRDIAAADDERAPRQRIQKKHIVRNGRRRRARNVGADGLGAGREQNFARAVNLAAVVADDVFGIQNGARFDDFDSGGGERFFVGGV